jgi:methionyl-tRNA synthetase
MNRYLTTTLPYVNADPHIGFALELLQADTLARLWRANNDEVFFSTGTDEHGQKILEAAKKAGQAVQTYVDHYAEEVRKLQQALNLSTNAFVRTTDPAHIKAAQEMWRLCEAAGDIYKKMYVGLYCVGCEEYKTQKELDESGHCQLHPSLEIQKIEEENYFFRLSKYQERLLAYLDSADVIVPEWRRAEARAFVESGLEDFSISRKKEKLGWGVSVPGDESQVMYVWFDALTNYISTLGWPEDTQNFEKFWQNGRTLQVAGKDQVRFQSVMWQAMLMSANIKNTDQVFYHGFINSAGQKMSKSIGNVISPYDLISKYGADATRYLLLRHVHPVDDSDVTWERLDEWYTANLVNGLGNLVARVMKLAEDHLDAPVEVGELRADGQIVDEIQKFRFNEAIDMIFAKIGAADAQMTKEEPYKKIKSAGSAERQEAIDSIKSLVSFLITIAGNLVTIMPSTSGVILSAIRANKKPDNLFPRLIEVSPR